MSSNSAVVPLRQPGTVDDLLTAVLRDGARRLLAQAVEAEAEAFLATMREVRLPDGRERLVRHGHGPERLVQTGIGPVAVQRVNLRDRKASAAGAERIRLMSAILPRWARRTRSLDVNQWWVSTLISAATHWMLTFPLGPISTLTNTRLC